MSRSRRNSSAEFKTNLVFQLLKGKKELNVLAVENDIQPNLLRNWKKEFLTNASLVFDNKREHYLRKKLAEARKEKAEYAKKVGQFTMFLPVQSCLESIVPVCITVDSLFLRKNWKAKLSVTICIRIILSGEPVRCLFSLNCADIRLAVVMQADICIYA